MIKYSGNVIFFAGLFAAIGGAMFGLLGVLFGGLLGYSVGLEKDRKR